MKQKLLLAFRWIVAYTVIVVIVYLTMINGPTVLNRLRGNACLETYSLTKASVQLPANATNNFWISKGKLYVSVGNQAYEMCATGDPNAPLIAPKERTK